MRAAATTEHVLRENSSEANDEIAGIAPHDPWRHRRKTPKPHRPPHRDDRDSVNEDTCRGRDLKFTAKEMDFMTQHAQPLSRDVEIPLRSSLQVEPLMTKTDTHGSSIGEATETKGFGVKSLSSFLSEHGLTVIDKPSIPPHEASEAHIQVGGVAFFASFSGLFFKPAEQGPVGSAPVAPS